MKPTPKTVAWGHYDASTPALLRIRSGDTVEIRTLTTATPALLEAAGLPPQEVEQSLRDIHREVDWKRPCGHVLYGPISINGAE